MAKEKITKPGRRSAALHHQDPGKAELQRRMEQAREDISQTVEEIKETVEEHYESVKKTVTGVFDLREQFQEDPLVWSVGALSAGFALGYTLGYAHKNMRSAGGRHSELAAFADSLVDELSTVGNSLVLPPLNAKVKELFGFDLSDLLEEIGSASQARRRKPSSARASARRGAARKGSATKKGATSRAKNRQ